MKKMLLTSTLTPYYRMCSTDVYCSKQTSSSTKAHHPSFLRFWVGRRKTINLIKFNGAENVIHIEKPSKHS